MKKELKTLTKEEHKVIREKGTEQPFSGEYDNFTKAGIYLCKQCSTPLFLSEHKFNSHCGWPSFDDEIESAIKRQPDIDGKRVEILCNSCDAHLGHVFIGEEMTTKNLRHCVNSISMQFVSQKDYQENQPTVDKAYFAGGCFWGVEYLMKQQNGVINVVSGYMGGEIENPAYEQVCSSTSGHLEVVEISYQKNKISFEALAKLFFEIHDPTQSNGQGPDLGEQYTSAVFTSDADEQQTIKKLIQILTVKKYDVVTQIRPLSQFWKAEDYHQDYYTKSGKQPYCHSYQKKF